MQLVFTQDIQRDIHNWQTSIIRKSYGIEWKKFLPSDISEDEVKDASVLKAYLEKSFYQSGRLSTFLDWVKSVVHADQIQEDLEILLGEKFPPEPITAYITTFNRAPYDVQQHFFFLIFREKNRKESVTTIYRELMHFLFDQYYWSQCKAAGLNEQQIHALKESATVLLNPILEKRGLPKDMGYPQHQSQRAAFERIWQEKHNFRLLLDEVLKQSE